MYRKRLQRGGESSAATKKYIFVTLGHNKGGLGNLLCIYAAGLVLQEKLHMPLVLLLDAVSEHSSRDYRNMFKHGISMEKEEMEKHRAEGFNEVKLQQGDLYSGWDINSIEFDSSKHIFLEKNLYQNFPSFQSAVPIIIKEMVSQLEESYGNEIKTKYIPLGIEPKNCMFIHVRRGDYLTHYGGASLQDFPYYQAGLSKILELKQGVTNIYILSNDVPWCKEQKWVVPEGKQLLVVDEPDELKTMYIMSQCKGGAVISASTFSVWGALFGAYTTPDGVIVYPSKWGDGDISLPEEPNRWIKI